MFDIQCGLTPQDSLFLGIGKSGKECRASEMIETIYAARHCDDDAKLAIGFCADVSFRRHLDGRD